MKLSTLLPHIACILLISLAGCHDPDSTPQPEPVLDTTLHGSVPEQLFLIQGSDIMSKWCYSYNYRRQLTRMVQYVYFGFESDSIVSKFQYDNQGRLTAKTDYFPGNSQIELHRSVYGYTGKQLSSYAFRMGTDSNTRYVQYHYNANQTLRAFTRQSSKSGIPDSLVYRYGASGKIEYADEYGWDSRSHRFSSIAGRYWFTYNGNGLPQGIVYRLFGAYQSRFGYSFPATLAVDTSLQDFLSRLPMTDPNIMLNGDQACATWADFNRRGLSRLLTANMNGTDSILAYQDPITATASTTGPVTIHRFEFNNGSSTRPIRYELWVRKY